MTAQQLAIEDPDRTAALLAQLGTQSAALAAARKREATERRRLAAVVRQADAAGISRYRIARETGLARQTVLDWLKLP